MDLRILKWRIENELNLKLEFLKSGDESGISKLNWTLKFDLEYWVEFEIESWKMNLEIQTCIELWNLIWIENLNFESRNEFVILKSNWTLKLKFEFWNRIELRIERWIWIYK